MRTTSATGSETGRSLRGFTLIELSIVVFIVAVVLAISAPAFVRSYNSALVGETARAFATTCQLARLQAVSRQQPATLHIDAEHQVFWVTQASPSDDNVGAEQTVKTYQLSRRVMLASVESIETPTQAGRLVEIAFYPNGTCDPVTVVFRGPERGGLATVVDPITCRATTYAVK